ncbi:MAG: class I SAM-dependent methyltransferase [Candidatus Endonucleobacter sp. (ex Gigantidas childressi)]|nr:class I SAM-dependent methyltransferase [Candidatus Endonucleobacter sp. (ex Gigantidas childressi)]
MNLKTLASTSQLVIRNSDTLRSERLLILAPPADDLATRLLLKNIANNILGFTQDFSIYLRLTSSWQAGGKRQVLVYGATLSLDHALEFDGVLLFLQKSKPLMDFCLDMIASVITPEGKVWLVGENKEGIKSWRKRLTHRFNDVFSIDSARHCVLIEALGLKNKSLKFKIENYYQRFKVKIEEKILKVLSLPGVFCHGRLDRGTEVFLRSLTDIKGEKIMDFGCGAGVIGAFAAIMLPYARLTLVDCDALALDSAKQTLLLNNIEGFQVLASDGLGAVEEKFDLILSNPPFHRGVKTNYDVTEQFFVDAYRYLHSNGELRIVANSFLDYQPIIKKIFGCCEIVIVNDGFTVYKARKVGRSKK